MFLGSEDIKRLILEEGMIKGYKNLDKQLQPNGFDLTVDNVQRTTDQACLYSDGKILPHLADMPLIENIEWTTMKSRQCWNLEPGSYIVTFNEEVHLPSYLAAITIQRSTVFRCDCWVNVGSWDAGYHGRGMNKLVVDNKCGFVLERNARLVQMHFIRVFGKAFEYKGSYQNENLEEKHPRNTVDKNFILDSSVVEPII